MPNPTRIAIIGSSGSGKSTLARRLGEVLGAPVVELDAINWQPGWRPLYQENRAEFTRRVEAAIAGEVWITDGNYRAALGAILNRATDLVCLDFDRPVIMARVLRRSFLRSLDKRELWPGTGNREHFARWLDKEHPIRWAWDTFAERRAFYDRLETLPGLSHLKWRRLRRPSEVPALVESFARAAVTP